MLAAAPLLLVPAAASAQQDHVPAPPPGRSDSLVSGIAFDLSVSGEESEASVEIGGFSARLDETGENAERLDLSWSVKLTVPVGGADDITARSTLDALAGGPKLTGSLSLMNFQSASRAFHSEAFGKLMDDARAKCRERGGSDCDIRFRDIDFARKYLGRRRVNRAVFSGMWRAGIDASIGVNRFEHYDPATLGEIEQTEAQFSTGFYLAYYPSDAMSAMIGRVEYQNGFEAAASAILCKPVVVAPADDCVAGAPTAPAHVERLNLSLEYRRVFDIGGWDGASIAVSPKFTIDALSEDYEAELPIYLLPPVNWPISPGVSLTYSSRKDALDAGVFLRSIFKF